LERFVAYLYDHAPAVMVRSSKGADIDAACGQLSTAAQKASRRAKSGAPRATSKTRSD
jgi:adenine C2-methylase RlmN of 23S rRNA A2503 and tRNA A37